MLTCREANKFSAGDGDDELEEETMMETALDKIEPYEYFKQTLMSVSTSSSLSAVASTDKRTEMQQEQPQLYDTLTKILNPEETSVIQKVISQAEANAAAAVTAQAEAHTQGQHQTPQMPQSPVSPGANGISG